jgi:DNA polymerase III subunit alpha
MDISNQNKLSEFYEELKRLNIEIIRPDINECFADFRTVDKKFYYALGGIKAVGFEAISNVVKERTENGNFKSINDFLNRVNPKDMNKLQLEGLVKAGAFDSINDNRHSLFNSIPNFILKTKNMFENKSANQIDLFSEDETAKDNIIHEIEDWKFEERLSKEFEAIGFFISDHPINQFTEIFDDYKIVDYSHFNLVDEMREANIAATLLKVQERKTAKGNSYAVLKLTDLTSVFELFIFSDILELNREILKEGNSLLLTLVKSISNDENRFKRVNVQKIGSIMDLFNSPIKQVFFDVNSYENLDEISKILADEGKTDVNIRMVFDEKILEFKLKNPRNFDRKSLNFLRKREVSCTIN